jgi:hypothetical protein
MNDKHDVSKNIAISQTIRQPDIEPIRGGLYRLRENYVYETEIPRSLHSFLSATQIVKIDVPRGFEYDGASVPRIAWSISGLRPDGLIRAPALVHDWLYTKHEFKDITLLGYEKTACSRKEADDLFLQIMLEAGMKKYRAKIAYWAVRWFGAMAWKKGPQEEGRIISQGEGEDPRGEK